MASWTAVLLKKRGWVVVFSWNMTGASARKAWVPAGPWAVAGET